MEVASLFAVAVVLVGLSSAPSPVAATVMVELALEDMAREAEAIVHGRVVRSGVQLAIGDDRPTPYTVTTLAIDEWIKGDGGERLLVREIGGVAGGRVGMAIAGVPQFAPGEEVVLFLERDPDAPRYRRTFGMVQGKFVVLPGSPPTVERDTEAVSMAEWTHGRMTLRRGNREVMALETFFDAIRLAFAHETPRREEGPGPDAVRP